MTSLIPRKKWKKIEKNVEIGQVVLVIDNNLPPSRWLIGRIIELLPSKDKLIRSVIIEVASKNNGSEKYKKKTTKLTRAIQKICILPTEIETDLEPSIIVQAMAFRMNDRSIDKEFEKLLQEMQAEGGKKKYT